MAAFHKHADFNNKDKELTREPNGEPEARTLEYFKNINQTVIQTLYEMYKIDFELFNYNMNGLTTQLLITYILTCLYQTEYVVNNNMKQSAFPIGISIGDSDGLLVLIPKRYDCLI